MSELENNEKLQLIKYFFFVVRLSKGSSDIAIAAQRALENYQYRDEWFEHIDEI